MKENKQKRLILGHKEIYISCKSGTKDILGFSILFSLFCARGTVYYLVRAIRTRCACVNHLNVKLMVEALVVTGLSHYDLMDFAVCGTDRKDCMFGKG